MVHKKSEYRLQFRKLAEDLRKRIWEENVKFRESRRSANQATHYWSYQLTDERCECEDDEELSSCRIAGGGDASQHSTQAQLAIPAKDSIATDRVAGKFDTVSQAIALPSTSNGTRKEVVPQNLSLKESAEVVTGLKDKNRREEHYPDFITSQGLGNGSKILARTDSPLGQSDKKRNGVSEKDALAVPEIDAIPSAREAAVQTPDWKIPCRLQDDKAKEHKSGETGRKSVVSSPPNSPSQFSQLALPRTTRRHHSEDRKAPFAMFGWNSMGNTIADKKTHNVSAPEKEVYPEALLALKKRREQVEKFLTEERKKRQQRMSSTSSTHRGEVNHSSIWMSEYKDKFCHQDFKFEPFPFPCRKPPAAWRYI